MKKKLLLAASVLVLLLLSSCLAIIEAPTYSETIVFSNKSNAWMTITITNGDGESLVKKDFQKGDVKTLVITSKTKNVTISVTGPYFYDYSFVLDLTNCQKEQPIEANAGLVKVTNNLSDTISEISFGYPVDATIVAYDEDFRISENKKISSTKTKYLTVKQGGATSNRIYFKKTDGKLYRTDKGTDASDYDFPTPKAGKKLEVTITDDNIEEFSAGL